MLFIEKYDPLWSQNKAAGLQTSVALQFNNGITMNASNIATDATTGMQIATATTQKLGFYGKTPIVCAVLATGASHTADDIITALQNLGLVKQS